MSHTPERPVNIHDAPNLAAALWVAHKDIGENVRLNDAPLLPPKAFRELGNEVWQVIVARVGLINTDWPNRSARRNSSVAQYKKPSRYFAYHRVYTLHLGPNKHSSIIFVDSNESKIRLNRPGKRSNVFAMEPPFAALEMMRGEWDTCPKRVSKYCSSRDAP